MEEAERCRYDWVRNHIFMRWLDNYLSPIQYGSFRGCSRMGGQNLLLKVCHAYPTVMRLSKVMPYLKNIQNIYKSRDTPLEFC